VRRQRVSEPRQICFVLDGIQMITRNSRSHLGKILFEVRSVCAERERVYRVESRKPGNPQSRVGLPIEERRE